MNTKSEPLRILRSPSSQRIPTEVSSTQRWLTITVWILTTLIAYLLSSPFDSVDYVALLYLIALHGIAVLLSVRLPGGVYTGLINTSITAATITIGFRQALLIAPVTALIAIPFMLAGYTLIREQRHQRDLVLYETLWNSAALTLSLLPTGWLYQAVGGRTLVTGIGLSDYLPIGVFIIAYFLLTLIPTSLWVWLGGVDPRDYWKRYMRSFLINGLVATLILTPFIATRFHVPLIYRILGLMPYTLVALMLFSVTRAQITLKDRVADLRTLSSIGQMLNANLELDDLLNAIHQEIDKLLDASSFYLAMIDERNQRLNFVLSYQDGEENSTVSRPFRQGLTEYIIKTRKPLLLQEPYARNPISPDIHPEGRPACSFIGVPIIRDNRVIGVIGLRDYEHEYAYDENDVQLLSTIAASAAVALQNAHLYQQSQRQAAELNTLNKISMLVSTSLDLDVVLQTICRVAVEAVGGQKSAVFLRDAEGTGFGMAESIGLSQFYQDLSAEMDLDRGNRGMVMHTGKPVVIENVLTDTRFAQHQAAMKSEGIQSVVEVPLIAGDQVIGSLAVYYDKPQQFTNQQVELVQTISGQAAMAVQNARLFATTNARRRELETLFETSHVINGSLSLQRVLHAVSTNLLNILKVDDAAVLLVDELHKSLKGELWVEMSEGLIAERHAEELIIDVTELSRVRGAAASADVIEMEKMKDPSIKQLLTNMGLISGLGLPLVMHGEMLGLIVIGRREGHTPLETDTNRLARTLADQATAAIQNARLFELTDVALTRRVDELAALEAISQRMARRLDLQAVIEQVVHGATLATGAEISELLMFNSSEKALEIAARHGSPRSIPIDQWPPDKGIVGRALRSGQPVIVNDVSLDADYVETVDAVQSEMAVPIVLDNRRLGVINLESVKPNAFDQEQARFISNLAEHAAIAIQNAQFYEAVRQRAEEFQTLRTIAVDLLSSTNLRHTLRVIARHALARLNAKDVHIYLYDEEANQLTFGASLWADGREDVEFATPRPDGMTATVARTGETLVILEPEAHPLFSDVLNDPKWGHLESMVSVPLKRGSEVLGVFNIAIEHTNEFDQVTMHFLELLAAQAAVAIANARLTEQTRTGRDRLQAILNSIHDGILMFDTEGGLMMTNPRIADLLGDPLNSYIGQNVTKVIRGLHGLARDENLQLTRETIKLVRQIAEDPDTITRRMYTIHTPMMRVVDETSLPVISHDENIGRLFILRDVTHEQEMETYRQEMSNMLVHDLRSPLAGVITGLHMALDETSYLDENIHRDTIEVSVDVALNSANTLLRLVEQILDVNKLEAGEMSLVMEDVSLKSLAEESRDMLSGTAAEAKIEVSINAPADLPPISVDADKIKRVIVNLLDNALRYTPNKGLVRINVKVEEGAQTVSIIDTGSGIPADMRERVFERFFQGDTTRRQRGAKGSGLGLTFCRLAIEAHDGTIWVEEGPEGGAAFIFRLPAQQATSLARAVTHAAP